jgi:hypothetical protein
MTEQLFAMDWDASLSLSIVVGGGSGDTATKTAAPKKKKLSKYDKRRASSRRAAAQKQTSLATAVVVPDSARPVIARRTNENDDAGVVMVDNSTQSTATENDTVEISKAVVTQSQSSTLSLQHNKSSSRNDSAKPTLVFLKDDPATRKVESLHSPKSSTRPETSSKRQPAGNAMETLDQTRPEHRLLLLLLFRLLPTFGWWIESRPKTKGQTAPQPRTIHSTTTPWKRISSKNNMPRIWRNSTLDHWNWIGAPEFALCSSPMRHVQQCKCESC